MAGIPAQWIAIGNRLIHGLPFKVIAEGFLSGTKAGDLVTKEQLDAATFPFTGDALIDGTLNIDFTDTLSFLNGPIDRASDPNFQGRIIGDFIGYSVIDTDFEGLSGAFEGIYDIAGGTFKFPIKSFVNQLLDTDTNVFLNQSVSEIDYSPFFGVYFLSVTEASDSAGNILGIEMRTNRDGNQLALVIYKDADTGFVGIYTDENNPGFEVACLLADPDDTYWKFNSDENEGADIQLGFTGKNMFSQTLLDKDFVNDAAAGVGEIPVGGFYHTAGTLKIRLT